MSASTHVYVLDTNVLIHDPAALYRFAEHDIFVPMTVLEELDALKSGASEVARNARQASRFIDDAIGAADNAAIDAGLALSDRLDNSHPGGRLFLQTRPLAGSESPLLAGHTADNSILGTVLGLRQSLAECEVTLVSKDINLRIKARVLGIPAEDYFNDKVLDDIDLLHSGARALEADAWQAMLAAATADGNDSVAAYQLPPGTLEPPPSNELVYLDRPGSGPDQAYMACRNDDGSTALRALKDYVSADNPVWGVNARNREQNFALNLLLDPGIDFVTLLGAAGTGKTLLALAAGLAQCLDMRRYKEIVVTRATIPVGEDIGFLPGTEEEKMTPWMGALADNLEVLNESSEGGEWGRRAGADLLSQRIKIRSLNFMRGRTFLNRFVIIDEAQNLTPKQMKTLITRAGPDSKFVCLGNIAQIDTPYLSETSSGLTYVVDRFRNWPHSGHILLQRGERSRLADFASQNL